MPEKKSTRSTAKTMDKKDAEEASSTEETSSVLTYEQDMTSVRPDIGISHDALFSEEFLNRFVDMVSSKINSNFQTLISNLHTRQNEVADQVIALTSENIRLKNGIDKLEQCSRRNNIMIYGVPVPATKENTDETITKLFADKLKLTIPAKVTDRSHRLRSYNGKAPAIIVKFTSYRIRTIVLNNKNLLKSSGITIAEDLTAARASLRKLCCERFGERNVWSRDWTIMVKVSNSFISSRMNCNFHKNYRHLGNILLYRFSLSEFILFHLLLVL